MVFEEIVMSSVEDLHATMPDLDRPMIRTKLESIQVPLGGDAQFHVEVSGQPAPVLAWYLNNEMIEEDDHCHIDVDGGNHHLSIQNISRNDVGVIKCIAINEIGRDECEAELTIDVAKPRQKASIPKFTSPLKKLELLEGNDAHFEVSFDGNPDPKVEWFKDSIYLTEDYGVEIHTTVNRSELLLPDIGKDDSGQYHCVISNRLGRDQCSAELQVICLPVSPRGSFRTENPAVAIVGPPVIVEKPGDIRVFEGDSVCLVFRTMGEPLPKGTFLWEGKDIGDDIHFSCETKDDIWKLVIKQAELYLQGTIMFIAENAHGQAQCSVRLRVEESIVAPMFTKTAENVHVREGDRCQFTIRVKGKPSPRVEWYKNGRLLSEKEGVHLYRDGEKHSLIIKKSNSDYAGKFKCVAVNNAGEASCSAVLFIEGEGKAPKFLNEMVEQEALEGGTVKFDVVVRGKPKPEIKWYKNNILLRESKRFVMESNDEKYSLVIRNIDEDDCGIFKCAATNSYGSVVSEAFLNVFEKDVAPVFSKELRDVEITEHERLELEVQLEQHIQRELSWYRNGQQLKSSSRYKIIHENQRDLLTISNIRQDDQGEYQCVARNEFGECSTSAKITVHGETSKQMVEENVVMSLDENAVSAMPTVTLGDEGTNKPNKDGKHVFVMGPGKALTLTIKDPGLDDSADYKIVAANSTDEIRVATPASVSEEEQDFPPEFISAIDDIDTLQGGSVRFEVGIIGQPSPKVMWLKDGVQIRESAKVKFGLQNRVHSINLDNCDQNDIGCYECVAINSKGRISCQAMLNVNSDSGTVDASEKLQRGKSEESLSPKFHKTITDARIKEGKSFCLFIVLIQFNILSSCQRELF